MRAPPLPIIAVTVAAASACVSQPAPVEPQLRAAVVRAFQQLTYDSICAPETCDVVVIDPRVRQGGQTPRRPEDLPVLVRLSERDLVPLSNVGPRFTLSERSSDRLAEGPDSLISFVQVSQDDELEGGLRHVSIFILMRSTAWFGRFASLSMRHNQGRWVVESVTLGEI